MQDMEVTALDSTYPGLKEILNLKDLSVQEQDRYALRIATYPSLKDILNLKDLSVQEQDRYALRIDIDQRGEQITN